MATLGVHPRLAHMLLRARDLGALAMAADLPRCSPSATCSAVPPAHAMRTCARASTSSVRPRAARCRHAGTPSSAQRKWSRDLSPPPIAGATRCRRRRTPAASAAAARTRRWRGQLCQRRHRTVGGWRPPDAVAQRAPLSTPACYSPSLTPTASAAAARQRTRRYTLANGRGAHFADTTKPGPRGLHRRRRPRRPRADDAHPARRPLLAPISTSTSPIKSCAPNPSTWSSRDQAVIARRVVRLDAADSRRTTAARNTCGCRTRSHAHRRPRARHHRLQLDAATPMTCRPAWSSCANTLLMPAHGQPSTTLAGRLLR